MTCEHSYGWIGGGVGDKVWKIDQCSKCKDVRDVRVKEMNSKQPFTDPMQPMYERMFRCIDASDKKYPDKTELSRCSIGISMFIQSGRG